MNGNKANILGVVINSSKSAELLSTIVNRASMWIASSPIPRNDGLVVFTPNPEFLVEAQLDSEFKTLLNKADISLPDGFGLIWAGKILGQPIIERVSGADIVEKLLLMANSLQQIVSDKPSAISYKPIIGIAGARREVLEEAEELINRLKEKYPNIEFINLDNPKSQILNSNNQTIPKYKIQNTKYNVVFATHGMKKQENWIWDNKDKIPANVFMGVGGSLDFLTGYTKRAPLSMRRIGLEWLWRGLQRPKHFKRIWKATVVFGWIVIRERLRKFT